jgi:hypothetical protein
MKPFEKFGKKLFLNENKQQSESILKKAGKEKDDPDYKEIKRLVGSNNNYLGLFTKFFYQEDATLTDLDKIINFLRSDDSKKLNKNPLTYGFEDLGDEITEIMAEKKVNIFVGELSNEQKEFIDVDNEDFRSLAEQFYEIKTKKGFYKNVAKVKDFDRLISDMEEYIKKYKEGGNYDAVMDILEQHPDFYDIEYKDEDSGIIVSKVKTFEGSSLIGSQNWCIVTTRSHWISYAASEYTPRNQYFVWNFGLELSDPNYFTAYTVEIGGRYYAAFDFNNIPIGSRLPKHVKDLKEHLDGPDESELTDIQRRAKEEVSARAADERERQMNQLRARRENAVQHREEGYFENDDRAKAIVEWLNNKEEIEFDEENDEDIYDVLFVETYEFYDSPIFLNEYDSSEYAALTEEESDVAIKIYWEELIDDIGYGDDVTYYVDGDKIAEDIVDSDVDYYREDWRDLGIDGDLTRKGIVRLEDMIRFIKEHPIEENDTSIGYDNKTDDKDDVISLASDIEDMLLNLEDNLLNEDGDIDDELEEERGKLYDWSQEIQEESDDDYWEISEDSLESYMEERKREISDDPVNWLKGHWDMEGTRLKEYVKDYVDEEKMIQSYIDDEGYGRLSSYDGEYDTIEINDVDYYIYRVG